MDQLKELIATWRARGASIDTFHATMGSGYKVCADELEAALARRDEVIETTEGRCRLCNDRMRRFRGGDGTRYAHVSVTKCVGEFRTCD